MTELALGTANWGASYGAPGHEARVDEPTAVELAKLFLADGHRLVDTAPAYGTAEQMVGHVLGAQARVVTKLSTDAGHDVDGALSSVQRSCRELRAERLEGVLLHDAAAALASPVDARKVLDAVRASGLTARVGVSVYTTEQALAAVDELGADLLQVPCNLLDQRFQTSGCLGSLAGRGVLVHVRSVFLNGVLLAEPASLIGPLEPLAEPVSRLRATAEWHGLTPLQLSLEFARQLPGVAAVVCGAYSAEQLQPILTAWSAASAPVDDWLPLDASGIAAVDPRTWR